MKLILQNGQQFRSGGAAVHSGALTSVNVRPPVDFFAGKNTQRDGGGSLGGSDGDRAIFHLRLIRRYKVSLFVRRRKILRAGRENVKFRSFEINSAPRDCATFTRLEYLASRDIPGLYQSFRIPQTSIPRYASHRGKRDRRGNIRFSRRGLSRATDVFFLLFNVFPA